MFRPGNGPPTIVRIHLATACRMEITTAMHWPARSLRLYKLDAANEERGHGAHLRPPQQLNTLIDRPRLLREMDAGSGKLTLLLGPPGSGKTTLLAQSHNQRVRAGLPVAWLTLSQQHNDSAVLREHLQQAFAPAGNAAPYASGITGYVDGLDRLTSPAAQAEMDAFLLHGPLQGQWMVSALTLRGAAWHEARMRGLLHVVGPHCLRLADEEAAQLLGTGCTAMQARQFNHWVDGWVAGVQLFSQTPPTPGNGNDQWQLPEPMLAYFEEVLRPRLATTELAVLSELAVLQHFTPELLSALPQPPCDWEFVDGQIRAGHFLKYTDAARNWAAFHPAFGQYLRHRLRFSAPERHRAIKDFSVAWHRQNGFGPEVIRHAIGLPDVQQAALMIEEVGAIGVDLGTGPDATLDEQIPPERAAELPLLFLAQTYQRVRKGQLRLAQELLARACLLTDGFSNLHAGSDTAVVKCWAGLLDIVMRVARDLPIGEDDAAWLADELERHRHQHAVLAASLASVLAFVHVDHARFAQASTVCEAGLEVQARPIVVKAALWVLLHQASVKLARHSLDEALGCIDHAWQLAQADGAPDSYEVMATSLMRGIVLHEDGQTEAAIALIEPALAHIRCINGWVRLYAEGYAAAAAIAADRQGWPAAEAIIANGEAFARERNLPRLLSLLQITRLHELSRSGQLQAARQLLASAPLAALVEGTGQSDYQQQALHLPALLEAAALALHMQHPRQALALLQGIAPGLIEHADNRLRLHYHLLLALSHHGQRRLAAASTHLEQAIALSRASGLKRQLLEDARWLHELRTTLAASTRRLRSDLDTYLTSILPTAGTSMALPGQPRTRHPHQAGTAKGDALLSPRESQIMVLIAEGMINKEIATKLCISEGTVKTHRKKIHEKLGATTRSQAIMRARERSLI